MDAKMGVKFFVGSEYNGLNYDKLNWIQQTFDKDSYEFIDEGYFSYDRFVRFKNESDELLYRLKWS